MPIKEEYTRAEFHELIWSQPLTHLAIEWELPYQTLKELCEKLNIPKPDSGYWSKITFGKNPAITPLPDTHDLNMRISIGEIREALKSKTKIDTVKEEVVKRIKPTIKVAKKISELDPLVERTKEHYFERKHDRWDDKSSPILVIDVSKDNLNRAIRIADAFVKSLRSLGYEFTRYRGDTCLAKRGVEIPFKIYEKFRRESRMENGYKRSYYIRTGLLAINFKIQYEWRAQAETEHITLEDKLPDIVLYIEKKIDEGYDYQLELERGWARQQEEKRIRDEEKARRENELVQFQNLFTMSERFYKAQHIRDYICQIEERATISSSLTEELKEWIQWARDKADWLDPFINREDELLKDINKNTLI